MPIRELFPDSFDPETLDILSAAFHGACADLGVTDQTPHARTAVAKQVLELAHGRRDQRDPELIRAAVVAFLRLRH